MAKSSRKEWLSVLAVCLVLLTIFSFADLPLTLTIYNPNSIFGRIFQTIGELPNHLMGAFCGAVLIFSSNLVKGVKRIVQIIFGFLALLSGAFMGSSMTLNYAQVKSTIGIIIIFTFIVIAAFLVVCRIPKDKREKTNRLAMMGAVYFFTMLILLNLIKFLWGRMRFQFMTNPALEFTPWYIPNGLAAGNTYMSFPSGHAAQATAMLFLSVLPFAFAELQRKTTMFKTIAYIWVALVAFSRVLMGAHFATDVIFGFLMSWLLFQFWKGVFLKPDKATSSKHNKRRNVHEKV